MAEQAGDALSGRATDLTERTIPAPADDGNVSSRQRLAVTDLLPAEDSPVGDPEAAADAVDDEVVPPVEVRAELDLLAALLPAGLASPIERITYRVEEWGEPVTSLDGFRRVAAATFGDPRGWTLGGAIRFEEAGDDEAPDFVLALAVPDEIAAVSDECVYWATGEADASCTAGGLVMINDVRWQDGAINDPYPLDEFRQQELNHELGHWLGEDHWTCAGGLAPVNQQQFRHLDGCRPNAWPLPWERVAVALRRGLISAELSPEAAAVVWSGDDGSDTADGSDTTGGADAPSQDQA